MIVTGSSRSVDFIFTKIPKMPFFAVKRYLMDQTTAKTLAHTMNEARNLTRFYSGKLKGEDMHRQFEVGDYTTNTPFWILAHLTWAENMLLLQCMGHAGLDIPWLNDFKIGSVKKEKSASMPDLKEVLTAMKQVHEAALDHLSRMTDAELEEDNALGMSFGENRSKRFMAMHAIRHEAIHTGQLSLLVKMYGKATV